MRRTLERPIHDLEALVARLRSPHAVWHTLIGPHGGEGRDASQEYMTRAVFGVMVAALAVFALVIVAGCLVRVFDFVSLIMILPVVLPIGGGWWLVLRGRWRLGRFVPPSVFLALGLYANWTVGLSTHFALFYAIAILLSGMLVGNRAQWLTFGLCIAAYVGAGWPHDPWPPADRWPTIVTAIAALAGISLLRWLSTNQVEHALRRARAYASELQTEVAERRQAEAEIRRQAGTLSALHETALDLAARPNLPELLQAVVARAASLLGARSGAIHLYRPETDDLENALSYNLGRDFSGVVLGRGEGLAGQVLATDRPIALANYQEWPDRSAKYDLGGSELLAACVAVPIQWGSEFLGVLSVLDESPRTFSPADVAMLEQFAPLAAAALVQTRLVNDLHQRMQQLQAAQAQLVQSGRLAAVGELAAGVAHELNNPLTPVLGFSELLLRNKAVDGEVRHDLEIIAAEARRARDIVRSLLDFSQQAACSPLPADVNRLLAETLMLMRSRIASAHIGVEERYAADLPLLLLDTGRLKQVWLNLLTNAAQAMPAGGRLTLATERVGDRVAVRVSDTGVGIPAEILPRIFDPFFTTRPVGKGTGLGLPVSLGIVQDHGGTIEVTSQVGQGSRFTVWLPVAARQPSSSGPSAPV